MKFASISGKKWVFKKFSDTDIKRYIENYSLNLLFTVVARVVGSASKMKLTLFQKFGTSSHF